MNDLKPQLAPGWSGVNIALLIVSFLVFKPFGLLMLAYILVGGRFGLHLGHPETFVALWGRITEGFKAGAPGTATRVDGTGGTPAPAIDRQRELDEQERRLTGERETLARERAAFDEEKRQQTERPTH